MTSEMGQGASRDLVGDDAAKRVGSDPRLAKQPLEEGWVSPRRRLEQLKVLPLFTKLAFARIPLAMFRLTSGEVAIVMVNDSDTPFAHGSDRQVRACWS